MSAQPVFHYVEETNLGQVPVPKSSRTDILSPKWTRPTRLQGNPERKHLQKRLRYFGSRAIYRELSFSSFSSEALTVKFVGSTKD